jgi:hypothetical protein
MGEEDWAHPQAFQTAFGRFMATFGEQARFATRGQLAVDGKSLRRTYDKGRAHMPPLVATFHHVSPPHLKRYVGEFDYRYNTRTALGFSDKRLTYRRTGGRAEATA